MARAVAEAAVRAKGGVAIDAVAGAVDVVAALAAAASVVELGRRRR